MLGQTFFGLLRGEHGLQFTDGLPDFWLVRGVVQEGSTEEAAIFFEDTAREVAVLVAAVGGSAEGGL